MHTFTSSDGVEIAYRLWDWERESALPPVLLYHGFIADGELNWVGPGVVDALRAAGRRVVAIDARGHGASSKPHDPSYYGEARMAEDASRLLDLLGVARADVVGYSMGAVVCLLLAVADSRVRRMVIGGVGAAVVELGGVDTRVLDSGALTEAFTAEDPASVADEQAAAFRAFADMVGADRTALLAQTRSMHSSPIPLDAITAPTLLLVGADDPLAARPEVLGAALPGARLRVVAGDHLGALRAPEFTPAVVDFLAAAD
ncbi:alpha/beta fold hydrolase [Thermobifida halotolerans]|uniref:Alpha/beta fold hydrolase n=1 Tax=Thermobifida halotolerans TaxID=483545 RepID=A0A399G723_9ACTN|nr:alpha/beta hydrolase [Thermobifida halotolerans]UOE20631.1 alpha/beta fold hydrolase [Thermobifida halotolerans]